MAAEVSVKQMPGGFFIVMNKRALHCIRDGHEQNVRLLTESGQLKLTFIRDTDYDKKMKKNSDCEGVKSTK